MTEPSRSFDDELVGLLELSHDAFCSEFSDQVGEARIVVIKVFGLRRCRWWAVGSRHSLRDRR
jgi:hypothetical protein